MIALVFSGDLKYCPYISRYVERLELKQVEYKIYFWNRGGLSIEDNPHYDYFDSSSDLSKGKFGKLFDFIHFRKWIITKLKNDMPDKIIALSTLTGVLLGKELYKRKDKYIFDIRDYSYEHISLFYKIEKKVINNSKFTAISSRGFESFLPEKRYVVAHNFNRKDIVEGKTFKRCEGKIPFVWNGVIRYFEFQKQYLDALKNDERFEIVFHGDGPELNQYTDYCVKNGFTNVTFTGSYDNSQKAKLLDNAGILNNCYGYTKNAGNKLKYAVSNRFYDGMVYHIPQLVELDGFKPQWAQKSKIGTSLEANNDFADALYEYYNNIDPVTFDIACEDVLQEVINDDDEYIWSIDEFISAK